MILLVEEINKFNILLIFVYRIFFKKIFFLTTTDSLKKKYIYNFFNKIKIFWINYEEFEIFDHTEIKKKSIFFTSNLSIELTEKLWNYKSLKNNLIIKKNLEIIINNLSINFAEKCFELIRIINHLKKKNLDYKFFIFCNKNLVSYKILKKYNLTNLNLINFNFFKPIFKIINYIYLNLKIRKNKQNVKLGHSHGELRYNNSFEHKVVYFPHKGVHDGYYLKDYFYSKKNKKFLKKNILHVEWDLKEINKKSEEFYYINKIPLAQWKNIKYSFVNKCSLIYLKNLLFFFIPVLFLCGFSLGFLLLVDFFKILISTLKLKKIKNLEIIFVGNEYLFPTCINVASIILKKKIFTLRDRTIQKFVGKKTLFTKYFSIYKQDAGENNEILISSPRLRMYNDLVQNSHQSDKSYFNCLVVDRKSNVDWFTNGRNLRSNWKNNVKFLEDILEVAKERNDINFSLKCKNYNWTLINDFQKVYKSILSQNNIELLDNEIWSPLKCISSFDLIIGQYTSLMDEFIMVNKPIIICDDDFYPISYINFNKEIFATNKIELKVKLIDLKQNKDKYIQYNKEFKKNCYNKILNNQDFENKIIKEIEN